MLKKFIYSFLLISIASLFLYFYVQKLKTVNRARTGALELALRENRLLPLRKVQAFVSYRMATELITLADDLLPDAMKKDPWGTPYECRVKKERFYIHSAGPNNIMTKRPLKPCDDILIFKSCVVDLSTPLPDLNYMMKRFSEPLIAEALLNCNNASYRNAARNWLESHAYRTSYTGILGPEVW